MAEILVVHAFTRESIPNSGNPAGVVLDADGLTDAEMQAIAAKVNVSETAFVLTAERATRRLRFFTPEMEIDFCGHATLAAWWSLAKAGLVTTAPGISRFTQETNVGILQVDIHSDEDDITRVVMTQGKPVIVEPRVMGMEVVGFLNVPRASVEVARAPIQVASTGLNHLIVPVDSADRLTNLAPDLDKLGAWCEKRSVHTVHVFTVTKERPFIQVKARAFMPHLGIDEDPATGSASGALGLYLVHNRIIPINAPVTEIQCFQGEERGHPSRIDVEVVVQPIAGGHKILKVKVGGTCARIDTLDVTA